MTDQLAISIKLKIVDLALYFSDRKLKTQATN
jgi:hypothetical protein